MLQWRWRKEAIWCPSGCFFCRAPILNRLGAYIWLLILLAWFGDIYYVRCKTNSICFDLGKPSGGRSHMLNDLWVIVDTYIQGNWEQSPGCNPWNWTNVARDTVVCIVAVSYCIARYGRQLRFLVWFDFGTFSSGGYLWICYHQWMKFFVVPVVMGSHVGKVLLQHCLQHVHPICSALFSHISGDSQVARLTSAHIAEPRWEKCPILLPRGLV